jgi:hypothetical protein
MARAAAFRLWGFRLAWDGGNGAAASLLLCLAAGAALLACRLADPYQGAENFYHEHHRPAYYVLKLCKAVILAAFAFSAKFIVTELATQAKEAYLPTQAKEAYLPTQAKEAYLPAAVRAGGVKP